MLTSDRDDMIAFMAGVLDYWRRQGRRVKDPPTEAAAESLRRGETIGLTVEGKIVSYMKFHRGKYREFSELPKSKKKASK